VRSNRVVPAVFRLVFDVELNYAVKPAPRTVSPRQLRGFFSCNPQRSTRLRCHVLVPDGKVRVSAGPAHAESTAAFIAAFLRVVFVVTNRHSTIPSTYGWTFDLTIVRSKVIASDKNSGLLRFAIAFLFQHELPRARGNPSVLLHRNGA
jgi:hypothetical protein